MRIALPVAAYELGTTGEYLARAFRELGHEAEILSQWGFYDAFREDKYDLYFCVDSGGPLNLFELSILTGPWRKLAFWLIDFRRGKSLKNPNDLDTARFVSGQGGWVFQAQYEDVRDCLAAGITRVSWLPLAADPAVWSETPAAHKVYDVGFVGNVWDAARARVLESIRAAGLRLCWSGHGAAYMEAGARLLRESRVGFNISAFYGEPVAYDVNMRVFEALSCGLPLVTNKVASLDRLFSSDWPPFLAAYSSEAEIIPQLRRCLADSAFLNSGPAARQWILEFGTYRLRAEQALATLKDQQELYRQL